MLSYFEKLTGEGLSRYLNKIESTDLERLVLAPSRWSVCKCCKMFTFPCPASWRP